MFVEMIKAGHVIIDIFFLRKQLSPPLVQTCFEHFLSLFNFVIWLEAHFGEQTVLLIEEGVVETCYFMDQISCLSQ